MRRKIEPQLELEFQASNLELTNTYFAKYEAMSKVLLDHPELVELVHRDLGSALRAKQRSGGREKYRYTSDQVLRILICQWVEGLSLRGVVVRVDDSRFLRQFARIGEGQMMDFTTLCKLKNSIRPQTWEKVNRSLARVAVAEGRISGESLRLDTTAVETNVHWPSDSGLLLDSYRILARLIRTARELDAQAVGNRRLHVRRAKRQAVKIARKSRGRGSRSEQLKAAYRPLIEQVEGICDWALSVASALNSNRENGDSWNKMRSEELAREMRAKVRLARKVAHQSRRRVLEGRPVRNDEKLFSVVEPHTELLVRGKAGKNVEFGHMVQIQQVEGCFITDYSVFAKKPAENTLVLPALASHRDLFGSNPVRVTADKAYWSSEVIPALEKEIKVVSIAKGGRPKRVESREQDPLFRLAQRFRAGIEGTISFLKRVLGLERCLAKGWRNYAATIGGTIFAHNLIVLARA